MTDLSLSNQTATELLRETAGRGCHFEAQGDGPPCEVEWPDDTLYWCTSCFAKLVLYKQQRFKPSDCPYCRGARCFGTGDPPSLRCTR